MQIDFYLANSNDKLQEAFDLVSVEYKKDGYINADAKPEMPGYNFLPTSATFIAKLGNEIIGTVTIVGDGEKGLPMEEIYKAEIEKLRLSGKKIAEISQLALKREAFESLKINPRKFQIAILIPLFRLVYSFAKARGIDKLCISINPKHDIFYKSLGFEEIGELKYYPSVNNAPALARMLDISQAAEALAKKSFIFDEILKNPLLKEDFQRAKSGEIIFSLEV